jgi:HEAT repeat protein
MQFLSWTGFPRAAVLLAAVLAGCTPLGTQPHDGARSASDPPAKVASQSTAQTQKQSAAAPPKTGDGSPRSLLANGKWLRVLPPPQPPADSPEADSAMSAAGAEGDSPIFVEPKAGPSPFRWRHAGLEELDARRADLCGLLADRDAVVASDAAIGLARSGNARALPRLCAAAREAGLPIAMRCAAIEALAALPAPAALGPLGELSDEFGAPGPAGTPACRAALHAELIRGLARHVDAAADPRFTAALASPAADVRLEALLAWAAGRGGTLPPEAVDLRSDGDPRVRAAALRAMAARRHPQAQRCLAEAMRDGDLHVRLAAIAALGELGDADACATLSGLLKERSDRMRAAAVAALDRAGAKTAVLGAAGDASWHVRLKVADALARYPDREGISVARQLLDDSSAEVQRRVVIAVAKWPLARGGPVLLEAMNKPALVARKTARERLSAQWPAAAAFPAEAAVSRRQEVLDGLQARFQREFGLAAPLLSGPSPGPSSGNELDAAAVARVEQQVQSGDMKALAEWGPELLKILEHLAVDRHQVLPETVYRDVLPRVAPAFAWLALLESQSLTERRRAAEELLALSQKEPLGSLAVARLSTLIAAETDGLVWRSALEAVAADPAEPAVRMACTALGHPSPEVRRRACEHLAAHPSAAHARHLVPLLADGSQAVVVAAIRALAAIDSLDDLQSLRASLASTNEEVQLEAAAALARFRDPSGIAALERLTYSGDFHTRARAAQTMGDLAEPSFAAALVRLLDDRRATVAHTALLGLPKVTGRDVARAGDATPPDADEQARRWKQWLAAGGPSP